MEGYSSFCYAQALAEYGSPLHLKQSDGWVLVRPISGFPYSDAMGCYPIFSCSNWSLLSKDIEELPSDIIALSLVTDPFGDFKVTELNQCFPDLMVPFKQHFVTDLTLSDEKTFVSSHHRRNANKALRYLDVEIDLNPLENLDQWCNLYAELIQRHNIHGMSTFSRQSFAKQFQTPGLLALQARHNGAIVGMLLWFIKHDVAYYHLAAYSALGYELNASFALFWKSIELLSDKVRWLSLGASPGTASSAMDGLSRFKAGWATGVRDAYLCGRILEPALYQRICREKRQSSTSYFPAYRKGEFA